MMAKESEESLSDLKDFDIENAYTESVAVLEYEDTHRGEKLGTYYLVIQLHFLISVLQIFPSSLERSFELVEPAIMSARCILFCCIVRT
jgi:hypothetical protein